MMQPQIAMEKPTTGIPRTASLLFASALLVTMAVVAFGGDNSSTTDEASSTTLFHRGALSVDSEYFSGQLYSDSNCTIPTTVDVTAYTRGFLNITGPRTPWASGDNIHKWYMVRDVPSNAPFTCSIDGTLASANPPFSAPSFQITCNKTNGNYLFINYEGVACEGPPSGVSVLPPSVAVPMITGGCFVAPLHGMGLAPAGIYMRYNGSLVADGQQLCHAH